MGRRVMFFAVGALLLLNVNLTNAVSIAESYFTEGDEGWTVVSTEGYSGSPDWSSTGGYIYDTDMDNGGWGFLAPSKFLGDVSAAFGNLLEFDFAGDRLENEYVGVVLVDPSGVGIIIHVDLPETPYVAAHRALTLDTSDPWLEYDYINGTEGDPATNQQILDALSNLQYLLLGAEFAPGYDNDGEHEYGEWVAYDNIVLTPEPATVILFALGALCLPKRRK